MAEVAHDEAFPEPAGGTVVDRAVIAERRARRAEAVAEELRKRVAELEQAPPPDPPPAADSVDRRVERLQSALSSAIVTIADLRTRLAATQAELAALREREAPRQAPARVDPAALAELARELAPTGAAAPDPKLVADLDAAAAALRIVSPDAEPPRRVHTARGTREYPQLRGAVVKLAHDDPHAAARLIAGLLPAQWREVGEHLDYDLTITELGTYAVTLTAGKADVALVDRPRRGAEFHLRADALTLAELIAGFGPRPRLFGRARVRGRRRRLKLLEPVRATTMTLDDALRAGAVVDPALALRCLAYAVPPSWTRGSSFAVSHTLTDPGETLFLTSSDGRGLAVSGDGPPAGPDATVVISRPAFDALMRGEAPERRPVVRGDYAAVDQLRDWADRVRLGRD